MNLLSKKQRCDLKKTNNKYNKPEKKIKKTMYEKNKYRNMTEEHKNKTRDRERNRYRNMIEEGQERKREYARIRYQTVMIKVC